VTEKDDEDLLLWDMLAAKATLLFRPEARDCSHEFPPVPQDREERMPGPAPEPGSPGGWLRECCWMR
jgi:hypothetical protein